MLLLSKCSCIQIYIFKYIYVSSLKKNYDEMANVKEDFILKIYLHIECCWHQENDSGLGSLLSFTIPTILVYLKYQNFVATETKGKVQQL